MHSGAVDQFKSAIWRYSACEREVHHAGPCSSNLKPSRSHNTHPMNRDAFCLCIPTMCTQVEPSVQGEVISNRETHLVPSRQSNLEGPDSLPP